MVNVALISRVQQTFLRRALEREFRRAERSLDRLNQLIGAVNDPRLQQSLGHEAARLREARALPERPPGGDDAGLVAEHRALVEDKRAFDKAVEEQVRAAAPRSRRKLEVGHVAVIVALGNLSPLHDASTSLASEKSIERLTGFSQAHVNDRLKALMNMKLVRVRRTAGRPQTYELTVAGRDWLSKFRAAR